MLINLGEDREVFREQFSLRNMLKYSSSYRIVQSLLSIQSCNAGAWPK